LFVFTAWPGGYSFLAVQTTRTFSGKTYPCARINGNNFGGPLVDFTTATNPKNLSVLIDGQPCLQVLYVTHTAISCCTNLTSGLVNVTVNDRWGVPGILYPENVDPPPKLYSIYPTSGPSSGGAVIEIRGTGVCFPSIWSVVFVDGDLLHAGFLTPILSSFMLYGQDLAYSYSSTKPLYNESSAMACQLVGNITNSLYVEPTAVELFHVPTAQTLSVCVCVC
jgi:hypothetical protein